MNSRWPILLLALVTLALGLYLGGHPGKLPGPLRDVFVDDKLTLTAQVLDEVDDRYWKEVGDSELDDSSARGIVKGLQKKFKDPFSEFFDAKQFSDFNDLTNASYAGVGLGITQVPEGLRVSTVFPESPAKEAGIEQGDIVIAVNGEPLAGVDSTIATGKIKGEPGTDVTITVRAKGKKPTDIELTRRRISVPVIKGKLIEAGGKPVAYVRMVEFSPGVSDTLRKTIERLRDEKGAQGLILDLRDNGGGLLNEAVATSSIFLDHGTVVTTKSRSEGDTVYGADGSAIDPIPAVVLTNKNTASAAEILTAAMTENDLAVGVGQTTYGKGVYQSVIPLEDGAGLKLTVGEYLTSDGTSIAHKGVVPEVKVPDNPKAKGDPVLKRGRQVLAGELPSGK